MRIAPCTMCQRTVWVNACTLAGRAIGEYCADCFHAVPHDTPRRPVRTGASSGADHNDPGFDNVIRALEEDR
jgi:hypothetical protein